MSGGGGGDASAVLRGILLLWNEAAKQASLQTTRKWRTSSVRTALLSATDTSTRHQRSIKDSVKNEKNQTHSPPSQAASLPKPLEVAARLGMVAQGISSYMSQASPLAAPAGLSQISKAIAQTASTASSAAASVAAAATSTQEAVSAAVREGVEKVSNISSPLPFSNIGSSPLQSAASTPSSSTLPSSAPAQPPSMSPPSASAVPVSPSAQKWGPDAKGFPFRPSVSSEYDPIMDPTVAELDLEKILGLKKKKGSTRTTPGSSEPHVFDNLDFRHNQKLKDDLDVRGELIQDKMVDQFAKDVSHAVDDALLSVDNVLESTKDRMENLKEDLQFAEVSDEQLNAIEEKLQSLRGTAFMTDFNTVQKVDLAAGEKVESTLREVVSTKLKPPASASQKLKRLPVKPSSSRTTSGSQSPASSAPKLLGRKPLAKEKPSSLLSDSSRAVRVPDSRLSRLVSFGSLAAGLSVGTLAEMTRRTLGGGNQREDGGLLDSSPFLTEANANRIVATLCKVRGAALKLGQMMSLQDNAFINPELQRIFERVRQSADFMPDRQLQKMLQEELGEDWRNHFIEFDERPFAAASIGQVHEGVLPDGRRVAVKIQYPGVADGIDSDINNLMSTLNVANILPETLFVDNVIEVAKRELAWECDYERERQCGDRFADLVAPYPQYYVPSAIPHLSTKRVLTTELIEGTAVDRCVDMDQGTRNAICAGLLELTLRELFQFGFMQTDPNWANFFYNASTQQIALVDFGACREYNKSFVDLYIEIIHGAATGDRQKVLQFSQEIGFLTGHEAKVMKEAHVDAVMILGEAFRHDHDFSFSEQATTRRIQELVPTLLQHRMCPPPEEVYSLHRKMSGVYMLCARLRGQVNMHPLFFDIYRRYKFGGSW